MAGKGAKARSARRLFFYAIMLAGVAVCIELLCGIAWRILVARAERAAAGVDVSRSALADPHLGSRLTENHCEEYGYGLHDVMNSYKPGTPGWRLCTNSLGWRTPEFSEEKPQKTFRIVCMGDSSTMGQGVSPESTYCHLLGRRLEPFLRKHGLEVETINAGVWGHSSLQGLIVHEMFVRRWRPDLVTVSYGTNDRQPLAGSGRMYRDRLLYSLPGEDRQHDPMPMSGSRFHTVTIIRYAGWVLRGWRYAWTHDRKPLDGMYSLLDRRSTPLEYEENIATLLDRIRENGALAVVLGIAIREQEYRDVLERAARERNLPFVPTWEVLAAAELPVKSNQLYPEDKAEIEQWLTEQGLEPWGISSRYLTIDGAHPTKIGHRIIATALHDAAIASVRSRIERNRQDPP